MELQEESGAVGRAPNRKRRTSPATTSFQLLAIWLFVDHSLLWRYVGAHP